MAHEDAHASERTAMAPLLDGARPGELWVADRHFCTGAILGGFKLSKTLKGVILG